MVAAMILTASANARSITDSAGRVEELPEQVGSRFTPTIAGRVPTAPDGENGPMPAQHPARDTSTLCAKRRINSVTGLMPLRVGSNLKRDKPLFPGIHGSRSSPVPSHLILSERRIIRACCSAKVSLAPIAMLLGRPRATIHREIGRKFGPRCS